MTESDVTEVSITLDELNPMDEWGRYKREQAKAYLLKVQESRKRIKALEAEADRIREDAAGLRGHGFSSQNVKSTPSPDAIPNAVAKLEELASERVAEASRVGSLIAECGICLESLGGWEADLLRMHYVAEMTLVDIGKMDEWKHDRQYMSVMHLQALERFYDHMPHSEREPIYAAL